MPEQLEAMVPKEANPDTIAAITDSPQWSIEPKYDGIRALVVVRDGKLSWLNRNGEPLTKATPGKPLAETLATFGDLTLDGEIVTHPLGRSIIFFDVLRANGADLRHFSLLERRQVLEALGPKLSILVSPHADSVSKKHAMLLAAANEGWEGVVLKDLSCPYRPGRSFSWMKLKFTSTVDCIVVRLGDEGKDNATLAVLVDGSPVEVGRCSTIGKGLIRLGDVVEVRHLPSLGRLREPRILRARMDKPASECTVNQLPSRQRAWARTQRSSRDDESTSNFAQKPSSSTPRSDS